MELNPVEGLLQCTRPILFENNDDVYRYSLGATCFIIEYMSSAFVVTANHCLKSQGTDVVPESILIQQYPGANTFLPISMIHKYHESLADDAGVIDIAIVRIATEKMKAGDREKLRGFKIKSLATSYRFVNPHATFVFRGYPFQINKIEIDTENTITYNEDGEMYFNRDALKSVIRRQAFQGDGLYVSRSSFFPFSHVIRFCAQPPPIDKPSGLSGSPVFQIEAEGTAQRASLIGIITNANSEVAHFLDAIFLFKMLNEVE